MFCDICHDACDVTLPTRYRGLPTPSTSAKQKRMDGLGARHQKGHDYWSAVDIWFRMRTLEWGNQWNTHQWQEYVATH